MAEAFTGSAFLKTLVLLLRVILLFSVTATPTFTVGLSQEAHLTKETSVPISSKDANEEGGLGKIGPAELEPKIESKPPWEDHKMLSTRYRIKDTIDDLLKRKKSITEETWADLKKMATQVPSKQGRLNLIEMVDAAQIKYQLTTRKGFLIRWIDHILDVLRAIRERFWRGTATRLRELRTHPHNHLEWEEKVAVLQLSALEEYNLPLYEYEETLIKNMDNRDFQPSLYDKYVINYLYTRTIDQIQQSRLSGLKFAALTMLCFERVPELDRSQYLMAMASIAEAIDQQRPLSKNQVYFLTAQRRLKDRKDKFRKLFQDPKINWNLLQVKQVRKVEDKRDSEDFAERGVQLLKQLKSSFELEFLGDENSVEFRKYARAMQNLEDTYRKDAGWSEDQVNFVHAVEQLRGHPQALQIMMRNPDINWNNLLNIQ